MSDNHSPQKPQKSLHAIRLVNRLTFRQLQIFQAVYRLRSYSKAADSIGLTQPAVSAQIKQLEQILGQSLFEYTGRFLHITVAGESVAQAINQIFDQLNRLEMQLSDLSGSLRGELRINMVSSMQYVMPWLISRFAKLHPDIQVRLHVVNRDKAIESLKQQQADLAVLSMILSEKDLSFLPFLANQLIAVVSAHHPLAEHKELSPEQLLAEPLLIRELGSGTRKVVDEYYTQVRVTPFKLLELGSLEAIKSGLEELMGVSILPWVSVRKELQQGSLKSPKVRGLPLRRSWSLVHNQLRPLPATAQAFSQFVQQQLAELEEGFGVSAFEQALELNR